MKKIILSFLIIISFQLVYSQIERPANWKITYLPKEPKIGEEVEIVFTATLKKDWYMYSVGKFESAPSTTFSFNTDKSFKLIGSVSAPKSKHKKDEYIGEYDYFIEKAVFKQKIKVLSQNLIVSGKYEYSTCSNVTGMCLPPKEEEFKLSIPVKGIENETSKTVSNEVEIKNETKDSSIVNTDKNSKNVITGDTANSPVLTSNSVEVKSSESYFSFFLLAFIAGLAALLTPCVFPMIPMTVTYFLKASKTRSEGIMKALIYGFSIIFIYTIIGTLVAKLAGPEAANFLSTHWFPNIFFFSVFILFALSFLGLFEIVLPSNLVNAADAQADRGGFLGLVFMALTLVLVSFSCTGPIVGTILVASASGEFLKPIIGMFGFSLAFAIPFTLFAIFPSWLQNLPKSGGWLNIVKVVLGFIELGLAFKFLSLADQAYHWNLIDRNLNLAIWMAIALALALYLFGIYRLPHDSKEDNAKVIPVVLGVSCLAFVFYLLPGLFGAPLSVFSGYLPPMHTVDYQSFGGKKDSKIANEVSFNALCDSPKYAEFLHLPHEINGYFDYKQALQCSKKSNKPIFIDFTGHGCVNCREMEANVWADEKVLKMLKNDFIVLALYVDDKTELPEKDWYVSTYDGKTKTSIGKQNADFQVSKYKTNAQPYYLVVDSEGKTMAGPMAYDKNVKHFVEFLESGKANFSSRANK